MLSVKERLPRPSSDKALQERSQSPLSVRADDVETIITNEVDNDANKDDTDLYSISDIQSRIDLEPVRDYLGDAPLSILPDKGRKQLGKLLDIERPAELGKNYLELAWRIFPDVNLESLRYYLRKSKHPTAFILLKYQQERKEEAKLFDLVEALCLMKRLDAVEKVLSAYSGTKEAKEKKKGVKTNALMTHLKRNMFNNDDTVSICSVQSIMSNSSYGTLSSYASAESVSHMATYYERQFPLRKSAESFRLKKSFFSKSIGNYKTSSNVVFVAAAEDQVDFCLGLTQWLRKKGFDAKCIEPEEYKVLDKTHEHFFSTLQDSMTILVICSPVYKNIALDSCSEENFTDHDYAMKNVHSFMCREFFRAGGYCSKYIAVLPPGMQKENVPTPLSPSMACTFDCKDKESRQELLRKLYKKEKYEFVPVGPKPVIRTKVVTGDIFDLRK